MNALHELKIKSGQVQVLEKSNGFGGKTRAIV